MPLLSIMLHLELILVRLRAEQTDLMMEADRSGPMPCRRLLQRITDLESAIRSVEALIEDR